MPRDATCSINNPFATRWVAPGALAYRFPPGDSLRRLVGRIVAHHWRGAIVGPHGSGKSTLLAQLVPEFEAAGRRVHRVQLRDDSRRQRQQLAAIGRENPGGVLVVDGFEQLGRRSQTSLNRACLRGRCGLVITCHERSWLPEVLRTRPSLELAVALVEAVGASAGPRGRFRREEIAACYRRSEGNIRELFFALYDAYERQSHGGRSKFDTT